MIFKDVWVGHECVRKHWFLKEKMVNERLFQGSPILCAKGGVFTKDENIQSFSPLELN